MKIFFKIFLVSIISVIFLAALPARAQYQLGEFAKKAGYSTSASDSNTLEGKAQKVITIVLSTLAIVFLAFALYAGIRWMTAQGNEELVTTAKDTLEAAVIGMVIVSLSYAISTFVFNVLNKTDKAAQTPGGSQEALITCQSTADCKAAESWNANLFCDTTLGKCVETGCTDPERQCGGTNNCPNPSCPAGGNCLFDTDCASMNCVADKGVGTCGDKVNCNIPQGVSFCQVEAYTASCEKTCTDKSDQCVWDSNSFRCYYFLDEAPGKTKCNKDSDCASFSCNQNTHNCD